MLFTIHQNHGRFYHLAGFSSLIKIQHLNNTKSTKPVFLKIEIIVTIIKLFWSLNNHLWITCS